MRSKLLYASGGIAFICAVFHSFFWVMFDWSEELPKLSNINGAIMEVINILIIFVMLFQTITSFILAKKPGPLTAVEKIIVVFTGGFYFLRAVFGFPLFGVNATEAVVVIVCLAVALANLMALRIAADPWAAA